MVDHGAEVYSYGGNESESETELIAEKETLGRQNDQSEEKSKQLSEKELREAYERGKADAQKALEKALHTKPNMTPDEKYIRNLSQEIIGDGISDYKKKKITKRIAALYEQMNDLQTSGEQVFGNETISQEMDDSLSLCMRGKCQAKTRNCFHGHF